MKDFLVLSEERRGRRAESVFDMDDQLYLKKLYS
jgi:hypothetical protein